MFDTAYPTCPDFCRYLGEGRLCEVACGHGSPVCPYDDHAMVRAMAALGEIRFTAKWQVKAKPIAQQNRKIHGRSI